MTTLPRSFLLRWILPLFCLLCTGFVLVVGSLEDGENLLIQRKYKAAAAALQKALADGVPEAQRDRVLLLLGRAQWLAQDIPAAVKSYQALVDQLPGSRLVHKARFQMAEAYAAAGDYRAAAPIYQAEIERLVGGARKEEVAAIYLGLAEAGMKREKPDHERILTLFDLALDLGLSPERSRAVRLQAAEVRLASKNHRDAIQRFKPLVTELSVAEGRLRAMLGLGRALRLAGQQATARTILRDLIAAAGQAPEAADASYEIALTYGVPNPSGRDLDRAVGALRSLHETYPKHPQAKIALYLIARCYQNAGRSEDALASLRAFLEEDRSGLEQVPVARAMVGDVLSGQGRHPEAIAAWRAFLKAHPSHRDWERVQRAIVDTEFKMAELAFQGGKEKFDLARKRIAAFTASYPIDNRNPRLAYLVGEMLMQEDKFDAAREAFARCVSKYPRTAAAGESQLRIGEIFESKTFNYAAALEAYKLVRFGRYRGMAQVRIRRLTAKHLALFTPRTYRTGERASFALTSRNIEKVRVRVFKLDMETYFRSTHTAGQVERLDIEVIEPDKTFETSVPDYVQYKQTKIDVDVSFREAGAYIVKVDDRELEATTMVMVTDIALIAKSSRHEFFVFTQNLKENRAESGVRVFLSDGRKVLAEGRTGADGVWRCREPMLKSQDKLMVFTINAAGSGASNLNLSGLGYSQGLTPKGYLYTDRPAYQPGQRVHVKGIVREVQDGVYRLPQQKGYRVQIFSASGKLMLQREVAFTSFGTFAAEMTLPPKAGLGDWRIRVDRGPRSQVAFTSTFRVARYERPRLQMAVKPKARLVFRGEKIQGVFELRYFFGEPAVGKAIAYQMRLPDGTLIQRQGVTNASGEVEFDFASTEFGEEGLAVIQARVAEENVAATLTVPVVTTEFMPSLSLVRPVYLVGEPCEVTVSVLDRTGKPLARKGTAKLLRRQRTGSRIEEIEVATAAFATQAATGKGRFTFTAARGGDYIVRVASTDRFGATVTAQTALRISGEDDKVKLRLLTDRQNFRVGERVAVKVANRAAPRLILRTVQGDGILSYKTEVLPKGESTIEFELLPEHAPNFALAVAMIDGQRLHTAQREFLVTRDLQVAVTTPRATVRPGSEVTVEVTTKDPEGRPVAAEVSVAMVDAAVLALYPDARPEMGKFFYGARRETAFRTVSSCTWTYRGTARRISAELLAEERREAASETPPRGDGDNLFRAGRPGGSGGVPAGPLTPGPAGPSAPTGPPRNSAQTGSSQFYADAKKGAPQPTEQRRQLEKVMAETDGIESAFDSNQWNSAIGLGQSIRSRGLMEMAKSSDPEKPREDFSATGAWVPMVVTDAAGRASVKIRVPDSTTRFEISARGVTANTYVGAGSTELLTRKDLQVGVTRPFALVEGDRTVIRATVHNLSGAAEEVGLKMTAKQAGAETTADQSLSLAAQREGSHRFPLTVTGEGDVQLRLLAESARHRDEVLTEIPVQPYGREYRDGRAGNTDSGASFRLGLPIGQEFTRLEMLIEIGRDPGRDLIRTALGIGYRPLSCRQNDRTNRAQASQGLACLMVLSHLERVGRATPAEAARLRSRAAAALSGLIATQIKDGAIAWVGAKNADLRSTCVAVRFLAAAQRQGFATAAAPLNRAAEWLLRKIRRATVAERARIAWALTEAGGGRVDYSTLNALHRGRANMDVESLAHLALAWQNQNRMQLANEALAVLRKRIDLAKPGGDARRVEDLGKAATALLRAQATDALGSRIISWLTEQQVGVTYGTPSATTAALGALIVAGGRERPAASTAEVVVEVNGKELAVVPSTIKEDNARFLVPTDWLKPRDNRVRLTVRGRGRIHYTALLNGFAKGFTEQSARALRRPGRAYYPAYRRVAGKVLYPGFSVVEGKYRAYNNRMTRIAVGETGRAHVSFSTDGRRQLENMPFILEEWIPAGCSVRRESVQGDFDYVEIEPNRMTFYFREGRTSGSAAYELHARIPGTYRVLPARVYGASRPDLVAYGAPMEFVVTERGSKDRDEYRWTPDELYQLASRKFEAGDLRGAGAHLDRLLADWQGPDKRIRDRELKEVARMMLFISVERKDAKAIVRFFEVLKDRYEDLVIPFDKIVAVGKAYRDLGEFEQSVMVFRAAAESSYLKEAAVANTLERLGEVRSSVRFLRNLLYSYPDLNTMRTSLYSIGQKLASIAAGIPDGAAINPKVGPRDALRRGAYQLFREFLVQYPEDPIADEVSFAWATTCIEGEDLAKALAVAHGALERYPESTFTDEQLYTVGYAQFASGEHEKAFATLKRVATELFRMPDGSKGPSENKYHAIYLQGQIHHARGEPGEALAAYREVSSRFSDASEASDYFLRKDLSLPEVTTLPMDKPAELTLTYRNIKSVEVTVYRVDLMRLYILQKSLNNIRGIQLHGIRPFAEMTAELGDGRDYRSKSKTLALQLDKPGAYLVVVRSADRLVTGMALRSDLQIDAQEFLDVGRIRINVKEKGSFVRDARVKVIGSGDRKFRSGDTDLRGIFTGSGLVGEATVIVKKGDSYAFYRGKGIHQPNRYQPPRPKRQVLQKQRAFKSKKNQSFQGWGNNLLFNGQNRANQVQWLEKQLKNNQKGVEVYRTK